MILMLSVPITLDLLSVLAIRVTPEVDWPVQVYMNCFFLNVNKTYKRKISLSFISIYRFFRYFESVKICCFKSVQYGSRFGVILTFVGFNYEININHVLQKIVWHLHSLLSICYHLVWHLRLFSSDAFFTYVIRTECLEHVNWFIDRRVLSTRT